MIGCLQTSVRKQQIELYFESENELKFYNLKAWLRESICVTDYFQSEINNNQLARKFNASEPQDDQKSSVKVLMTAVMYLFSKKKEAFCLLICYKQCDWSNSLFLFSPYDILNQNKLYL